MTSWSEATARIAASCEAGGLDLVHPFPEEDRLGILIGNSRRLWPLFLAQADLSSENPLDEHVVRIVSAALAPFSHRVRYAHDPRPSWLPIQRIAETSGFARLSRTYLSIHPIHGPWIGLRAVAILDVEAPPATSLPPDRCEGCEVRCQAALDAAIGSKDWRRWLAVRDACSVGREWRYSEAQIAYHYGHARRHLG